MGVGVITIRPFDRVDVPAAVELVEQSESNPWSAAVFEDELASRDRRYLAAFDGRLVAYGGVMRVGDDAHITSLFVSARARGHGIGRSVLRGLFEEGIEMGAKRFTLEVRSGNDAAIDLYRRFGMRIEGTRPRYYGEHDALIMWARDVDAASHEWRSA